MRNYGVDSTSTSLITEESFPDATSEKELVRFILLSE